MKIINTREKKMKKILLSLVLVLTLLMPITQVAAIGENGIGRVTDKKTPTDVSQVTDVKSLKVEWGADPILYGNYLYAVETGTGSLVQINKESMQIKKSVKAVVGLGGWTPFLTAGDGQIFVSLTDGRVQAFNADTLESTWISESLEKKEVVGSRLTYYNGYLYFGLGGSLDSTNGVFACVKTKDTDPLNQMETQPITWSYSRGTSYYWSEAVIVGDCIAFTGYDGKVVLHDLVSNQVYDIVDLGIGSIESSLGYDKSSNKIIASNKSGFVATIDVDGHDLKDNTLKKSKNLGGQISSSPVSYNGRIYIAGGSGMDSRPAVFTVLDINTLDVIYANDKISGQCIPVLSTAYATEENNQEVQLYMINFKFDSNKQTNLYHITDNAKNTSPIYQSLYKIDSGISGNYWNGSLIMDDNAFYSYNGDGTIVRFGFDTSIQTIKDENLIASQLNKDIAALPTLNNVSIKIDTQLEKIASTYSRLDTDAKKIVKNIELVDKLQAIVKQQKSYVNKLNEDIINKLNIYYISQNDESLVNELMIQYKNIHEVNKTLVNNYQDVLKASKIIIELKQGIIPKDVFENIFNEDIDYTVKGTSGSLKYSFTFNGQDLKNTNPFSFKVNNISPLDNQIKKYAKNAFILDFDFEGEFPGKATFETETTLNDGTYALYYFNEKVNQIEFMQNVNVKNGMVSMQLTHASTYFISEKIDLKDVNEQVKKETVVSTNDGTDLMWPLIGVLAAGLALVVVFKKTKKK